MWDVRLPVWASCVDSCADLKPIWWRYWTLARPSTTRLRLSPTSPPCASAVGSIPSTAPKPVLVQPHWRTTRTPCPECGDQSDEALEQHPGRSPRPGLSAALAGCDPLAMGCRQSQSLTTTGLCGSNRRCSMFLPGGLPLRMAWSFAWSLTERMSEHLREPQSRGHALEGSLGPAGGDRWSTSGELLGRSSAPVPLRPLHGPPRSFRCLTRGHRAATLGACPGSSKGRTSRVAPAM